MKAKQLLKKSVAFAAAVCTVLTGFALSPADAQAAAAESVTISVTDKAGADQVLASWAYDAEGKTFTENGNAVGIVRDFTQPENQVGSINGQSYDFTAVGALPYTGINRKPDPRCLSVTTKGILLEEFYDYAENLAGMDLRGDTMLCLDANGFKDTFTYDQYWGLNRYYYPGWYTADSYSETEMGAEEYYVPTTLAILGYHGTTGQNVSDLISKADDANSLRISSGMQKGGNKTIEAVDGTTGTSDINEGMLSVKNINAITFAPNYYEITVKDGTAQGTAGTDLANIIPHAMVTTDDNFFSAAYGETVDITVTPDEGFEVTGVTVTDAADQAVDVTADEDGYSFTMPKGNVTVAAEVTRPAYDWTSTTWAGGLDFSWYDENDVQSSYHITTPAQWEALAWICSEHLSDLADYETNTKENIIAINGTIPTAQNTFTGVQFYLDNDIDMGGVQAEDGTWSGPNYYPIGSQGMKDTSGSFYGLFYGSFNGQGHYVYNVYANRGSGQSYQSVGLFGRVGHPDASSGNAWSAENPEYDGLPSIVIENIGVTGYIHGGRSVGGIVGKTLHVDDGNSVTIRNCVNKADVSSTDKKGVGGICGALWNAPVSVENCYSTGKITGGSPVGAIVGDNEGTITNVYSTQNIVVSGSGVTNGYSLKNKTLEEMQAPAFAEQLGEGFQANCGGTPVLSWETAKAHTPGEAVVENETAPTYAEDGFYESVVYCTECGAELSREKVATGEKALKTVAEEAAAAAKEAQDKADELAEKAAELTGDPAVAAAEEAAEAADAAVEAAEAAKEAADAALAAAQAEADAIAADDSATEEQKAAAQAAVTEAQNAADQAQTALDEANDASEAADAALEKAEGAAEAAMDAKDDAVVALAQLNQVVDSSKYTKSTYTVYADAYAAFEAIVNDDTATAKEVKAARSAVTKAYTNLVEKSAQKLTASAGNKTVGYAALLKAKKTYNVVKASGDQGKITYSKAAGSSASASVDAKTGAITIKKGAPAGTHTVNVKVSAAATDDYSAASKTVTAKITVTKAAQSMKATAAKKTVKLAKVKKAKQTVSAITVKNAKGTVTYKKASGSKNLTVNAKTGKITVKKGTKKGTYTAKIKVTAKGNGNYKAASKTVTVKVTVK